MKLIPTANTAKSANKRPVPEGKLDTETSWLRPANVSIFSCKTKLAKFIERNKYKRRKKLELHNIAKKIPLRIFKFTSNKSQIFKTSIGPKCDN